MQSKVGRWGGSCAIRLPKAAVKTLGLREGEEVDLQIENDALIIRKGQPRYDLADLVLEAKSCTAPESTDLEPLGNEAL